jgi:hypothetical protein
MGAKRRRVEVRKHVYCVASGGEKMELRAKVKEEAFHVLLDDIFIWLEV